LNGESPFSNRISTAKRNRRNSDSRDGAGAPILRLIYYIYTPPLKRDHSHAQKAFYWSFQSLEKSQKKFPMVGKTAEYFSNDWKKRKKKFQ